MIRASQGLALVLSIVVLSAAEGRSLAQTVPYRGGGTGVYSPITGHYEVSGLGTHLGRLTGFGDIATTPTANPLVFDFNSTGPQVWVAANGDTLELSLSGQVELIPVDETFTTFTAVWDGDFVVEGGTGRFKHARAADEPLKVVAINEPFRLTDPFWQFSWEVTGQFRLR